MKAIPTYGPRGLRFRSRLEAKWARFFDCIGWRWRYEPLELPGWIPDFLVSGTTHDLLVEVRPYERVAEWADQHRKIGRAIAQAGIGPSDRRSVFCVGLGPEAGRDHVRTIGHLFRVSHPWAKVDVCETWYPLLAPDATHQRCDLVSFLGECRTGWLFGRHETSYQPFDTAHVDEAWTRACNATQWRAA